MGHYRCFEPPFGPVGTGNPIVSHMRKRNDQHLHWSHPTILFISTLHQDWGKRLFFKPLCISLLALVGEVSISRPKGNLPSLLCGGCDWYVLVL